MLSDLLFRLRALFRRDAVESELDDELRFHLEHQRQFGVNAGLPDEEAARRARIALGGLEQVKEECRSARGVSGAEALWMDLRRAVRVSLKNPGFTLPAVIALALGIGANTAIFSFVHAVVLEMLPVRDAGRLIVLGQQNTMFHMENCCFPWPFYVALRRHDPDFEDILAVSTSDVNFTEGAETERLTAELVSGNYFRMLGVRAAAGRLLNDADDRTEGAGHVCVISYRLWQQRFGGRADVIGRHVLLNTEPMQIVGVSQPGFRGVALHDPHDLEIPSAMVRVFMGDSRDTFGWAQLIARLRPGITPAQAKARLDVLGLQIEKAAAPWLGIHDPFVVHDGSQGIGSRRDSLGKPVMLLFLLVSVVLLIACANLACLLLARSLERTREAGVRIALGASKLALVRQYLVESVLLAAAGGVAGWFLSGALIRLLLAFLGSQGEGLSTHVQPDVAVFAFSAAVTLAAGLLFGILPAWRAAHADPFPAIRGEVARPGRRAFASGALIAGQIALSLVLLFGAGLFVRTLHNLRAVDLGFHPQNLVLVPVDLSNSPAGKHGSAAFFEELVQRTRALPGTRAASLASLSVLSGSMEMVSMTVPGYVTPTRMRPTTYFNKISPGYFRTLDVPLLAGRDFTRQDGDASVIVNRQFARQFFHGDALGRDFTVASGSHVRVVGIAGNTLYQSIREDPQPILYLPLAQNPNSLVLQVRTSGDPSMAMDQLRGLVRNLDPHATIDHLRSMELQIDQQLSRERLLAFLSTSLGLLAVGLAAVGLYGVLSFSVARRTREIGIRMAIGARRSRVLAGFLAESAGLVVAGVIAGIPLALGCGRLASSLLFGLKGEDLTTLIFATVLLAIIAAAAAVIPSWRASRLDPMQALRYE